MLVQRDTQLLILRSILVARATLISVGGRDYAPASTTCCAPTDIRRAMRSASAHKIPFSQGRVGIACDDDMVVYGGAHELAAGA